MHKHSFVRTIAALLFMASVHGQAGTQTDPAALVKEGQKLEFAGNRGEALALYRRALEQNPSQFDAHLGIGRVMNVEGKYAEGRQHIQKAIDLAPPTGRNGALSTMGVAWAFEGNAAESAKYYLQVYDGQVKANALEPAAGTANALARVYLETGDPANAEKWYRTGYETASKVDTLTKEQQELWEMRWQHAQGRVAARRKQFDAARKHLASVRAIVERGALDEFQRTQLPYLAGYIALHEQKPDEAIAELSKADQEDPFVLSLLAQAYEQKKDQGRARELYKKVLDAPGHSLQVAFSRPLAQRKLAAVR
jgi:tetratricopeptide (TPR) repeat protein